MADIDLRALRFLIAGDFPVELFRCLYACKAEEIRHPKTIRDSLVYLRAETFDCLLVAHQLDDGDGLILAPTIKRAHPRSLSIFVTSTSAWATYEAAIELGFTEVLSGKEIEGNVISTIENYFFGDGRWKIEPRVPNSQIHLLTFREKEILIDISTGATNEDIAQRRHISLATVKSHLSSIYRKLDVRNRTEAISLLRRN